MTRLVFAAISTTGPSVSAHDVWEIALIKRHDDGTGEPLGVTALSRARWSRDLYNEIHQFSARVSA